MTQLLEREACAQLFLFITQWPEYFTAKTLALYTALLLDPILLVHFRDPTGAVHCGRFELVGHFPARRPRQGNAEVFKPGSVVKSGPEQPGGIVVTATVAAFSEGRASGTPQPANER